MDDYVRPNSDLLGRVRSVLGSTRAEYFRDEIFELFARPLYWDRLTGLQPCILEGGRGTGKTTALRGLSYEGQAEINSPDVAGWQFVGLYWRVETPVVSTFKGATVPHESWVKYFSHYFNLIEVRLYVDFLRWYEGRSGRSVEIDSGKLRSASRQLGLPAQETLEDLSTAVDEATGNFEFEINNVHSGSSLAGLSVLGRPIVALMDSVELDPVVGGKALFLLIDEYENLENYQQQVINTLIKHAGDTKVSYKIGVKETGHRERGTLNPSEQLIDPADYSVIDITAQLKRNGFEGFAADVCKGRLARLDVGQVALPVAQLLPGISENAEASALAGKRLRPQIRSQLEELGASCEELKWFDGQSTVSAFMIAYWAESEGSDQLRVLRQAQSQPSRWTNRLNNYQHAMLYTLRRGRSGLRKYYAGWDSYVQLADGNIRYLIQLVSEALTEHIHHGGDLSSAVSAEQQTLAAQAVGGSLIKNLQGIAAEGVELTRLVLSVGRVFQVMAGQPHGHAPEVAQFRVARREDHPAEVQKVDRLLEAGIMHLALRRYWGNKMAAVSGETKDFDYRLHPIFAPFFVYSYRSKRRLTFATDDLLSLIADPPKGVRRVLTNSGRSEPLDLPEQLELFKEYFHGPVE